MGAEVIYTKDSTRLFGGLIDVPAERGLSPYGGTRIVNTVSAVDFNAYADRRYVTETIPAGTLKAALQVLDNYLATYGVTLDAGQVNGPTLQQLIYNYKLLRECLDELSVMTGYVWEIDYNKILRMTLPGGTAAPFDVVPASDPSTVRGDITVSTERQEYANRIILRAGPRAPEDFVAGWHGNGVADTFTMYFHILQHYGFVWVDTPAPEHPETLGAAGSGAQWIFTEGTPQTMTRAAGALANGALVLLRALTDFPVTVQADDAAEQASQGLWETVVEVPAMYVEDAAQALADGYLERTVTAFKVVEYLTPREGILPGQVQTITVPDRNLSGQFLITDVEINDTADHEFLRRVRAVGGTTIPGSWRDLYREWSGSSGTSAAASATFTTPSSGPLLGGPAYLGGARNTSVAPSPAAWTPVPDYVPFTATTSFGGRVRAQIFTRNAGVTVTARLFNVTDAVAVATSSGVTSQTATEVTFLVSITEGKTYRLEVLSSSSGEGVFGIGVLESA
jgi:hypothetical protein